MSPKTKARRITLFVIVQLLAVAAVVLAFALRAFLDRLPGDGRISGCVMHDLWHVYCPGCGGTRAMVALFRGELLHSLCCNPLSACLAVIFVALDVRALIAICRNEARVLHIRPWYVWGLLALALLHFAVRNWLLIGFGIDYLGELAPFWSDSLRLPAAFIAA